MSTPNTKLLTVVRSVDLAAPPAEVWAVIGPFDGMWHPLIADIRTIGIGIGMLRHINTIDGKVIVERLEAHDESEGTTRYSLISGMPATRYRGNPQRPAEGQRLGCDVASELSPGRSGRAHCPDDRLYAADCGP